MYPFLHDSTTHVQAIPGANWKAKMELQYGTVLFLLSTLMASAQAQQDPSADCFIKLASDPKFAPIGGKMALGTPPKSTFAMLADESYPTEDERKLIADWAMAVEDCGEVGESYRQSAYPALLLSLVSEAHYIFLGIVIDLYTRKIPYGQFNRRRQATFDEVRRRTTEIVHRPQAQQQAQQQAQPQVQGAEQALQQALEQAQRAQQAQYEANRRQATLNVLHLLNQVRPDQPRQLVPYQLPTRPTATTTCRWTGDFLSCTTQ